MLDEFACKWILKVFKTHFALKKKCLNTLMFIGMLTLHYNTNISLYGIWICSKNGPSRGFFFKALLCYYTQSGNDLQKDLARFGYKLNMKVIKKESLHIFLAAYLKHT
jgi:hypothetical protein